MTGPDLPVPSETERDEQIPASEAWLRSEAARSGVFASAQAARSVLGELRQLRAELAELRRAAADELSRDGQGMGLDGPRRVDDLDVAEAMLANLRDADQGPGGRPDGGAAPVPDPEAIDRAAREAVRAFNATRLGHLLDDSAWWAYAGPSWHRAVRAVAVELGLPAPASTEAEHPRVWLHGKVVIVVGPDDVIRFGSGSISADEVRKHWPDAVELRPVSPSPATTEAGYDPAGLEAAARELYFCDAPTAEALRWDHASEDKRHGYLTWARAVLDAYFTAAGPGQADARVGSCGNAAPRIGSSIADVPYCTLPAGHPGFHGDGRGGEWGQMWTDGQVDALAVLRELIQAIDNDHAGDMTPLWARARALLDAHPEDDLG